MLQASFHHPSPERPTSITRRHPAGARWFHAWSSRSLNGGPEGASSHVCGDFLNWPGRVSAEHGARLSHRHALLVQQVAGHAPHFHSPLFAGIHCLAAECAVPLVRVGANLEFNGTPKRCSPIPAMHDNRIARRLHARVQRRVALVRRSRPQARIASYRSSTVPGTVAP